MGYHISYSYVGRHVFAVYFRGCGLSHISFSFAAARVRTRFLICVSAVFGVWAGLSYLAKAHVSPPSSAGRHVVGVPAADGVSHLSFWTSAVQGRDGHVSGALELVRWNSAFVMLPTPYFPARVTTSWSSGCSVIHHVCWDQHPNTGPLLCPTPTTASQRPVYRADMTPITAVSPHSVCAYIPVPPSLGSQTTFWASARLGSVALSLSQSHPPFFCSCRDRHPKRLPLASLSDHNGALGSRKIASADSHVVGARCGGIFLFGWSFV